MQLGTRAQYLVRFFGSVKVQIFIQLINAGFLKYLYFFVLMGMAGYRVASSFGRVPKCLIS